MQQKMLTLNAGSAEYQEYADQLAELDKKILETANSNAELKKSIVDLRFEQFDEAQDKLDDLIEDYSHLDSPMVELFVISSRLIWVQCLVMRLSAMVTPDLSEQDRVKLS